MSKKNYLDLFSKELFPEKAAWLNFKNDPSVKIINSAKESFTPDNITEDIKTVVFHNNKEATPDQINNIKSFRQVLETKGNKVLFYMEEII